MHYYETEPAHDLTYSDVFLVPSRSAVASRLDVSLAPLDGTGATIPIVSANMNSVTGPRLAATLARRGGLGVLPQDLHAEELSDAIRWVKQQPVSFDSAVELAPAASVASALALLPAVAGHGIVVRDERGDHLGIVPAERLATAMPDAPLGDLLGRPPRGTSLGGGGREALHETTLDATDLETPGGARAAFELMVSAGLEFAPVLRHGRVVGTLSRTAALRSTLYRPALDSDGRLSVAAAIGINGDPAGAARALAAAGADVIVIDTAHGHQDGMIRAIASVAALDLGLPIVAGNVVTAAAVRDLVGAGATIVKVGVGPGAMCTTRMMTAVGRPQFSAVLETAATARELGAHVWADGGVRYPRDVALALAAGAASVMIGSWFAGTIEAPGALALDENGRAYKESWGMASTKAVRERFGPHGRDDGPTGPGEHAADAWDLARKTLFAEGISSSRIYLDPLRPSLEDLVDMITSGVRSSLSYAGATTLAEFHDRALVGIQSAGGYEEGKALPVSW